MEIISAAGMHLWPMTMHFSSWSYTNCGYVHHYTITRVSAQKNHVYLISQFLLFVWTAEVSFIQANLQSHFVFQTFSPPDGGNLPGIFVPERRCQMSHPLTYWDYMKRAQARCSGGLDAIFIGWPLLHPTLADLKNCMFMGAEHCEHSKWLRFGSHT